VVGTAAPVTAAPVTAAPATAAPVLGTAAPATAAPITAAPVLGTAAPATAAPITAAPVTVSPVVGTAAPVTAAPVTAAPATAAPVPGTAAPVTAAPVPAPLVTGSPIPLTASPGTVAPVTVAPATFAPISAPITAAPVTAAPATLTPLLMTASPVTAAPSSGNSPITSMPSVSPSTSSPASSPTMAATIPSSAPTASPTLVAVSVTLICTQCVSTATTDCNDLQSEIDAALVNGTSAVSASSTSCVTGSVVVETQVGFVSTADRDSTLQMLETSPSSIFSQANGFDVATYGQLSYVPDSSDDSGGGGGGGVSLAGIIPAVIAAAFFVIVAAIGSYYLFIKGKCKCCKKEDHSKADVENHIFVKEVKQQASPISRALSHKSRAHSRAHSRANLGSEGITEEAKTSGENLLKTANKAAVDKRIRHLRKKSRAGPKVGHRRAKSRGHGLGQLPDDLALAVADDNGEEESVSPMPVALAAAGAGHSRMSKSLGDILSVLPGRGTAVTDDFRAPMAKSVRAKDSKHRSSKTLGSAKDLLAHNGVTGPGGPDIGFTASQALRPVVVAAAGAAAAGAAVSASKSRRRARSRGRSDGDTLASLGVANAHAESTRMGETKESQPRSRRSKTMGSIEMVDSASLVNAGNDSRRTSKHAHARSATKSKFDLAAVHNSSDAKREEGDDANPSSSARRRRSLSMGTTLERVAGMGDIKTASDSFHANAFVEARKPGKHPRGKSWASNSHASIHSGVSLNADKAVSRPQSAHSHSRPHSTRSNGQTAKSVSSLNADMAQGPGSARSGQRTGSEIEYDADMARMSTDGASRPSFDADMARMSADGGASRRSSKSMDADVDIKAGGISQEAYDDRGEAVSEGSFDADAIEMPEKPHGRQNSYDASAGPMAEQSNENQKQPQVHDGEAKGYNLSGPSSNLGERPAPKLLPGNHDIDPEKANESTEDSGGRRRKRSRSRSRSKSMVGFLLETDDLRPGQTGQPREMPVDADPPNLPITPLPKPTAQRRQASPGSGLLLKKKHVFPPEDDKEHTVDVAETAPGVREAEKKSQRRRSRSHSRRQSMFQAPIPTDIEQPEHTDAMPSHVHQTVNKDNGNVYWTGIPVATVMTSPERTSDNPRQRQNWDNIARPPHSGPESDDDDGIYV